MNLINGDPIITMGYIVRYMKILKELEILVSDDISDMYRMMRRKLLHDEY